MLLIDEIENGLHPRLLGGLVGMLEDLTKSGLTQVVATTHSPITLNYVSSPESVLLVTRAKGGGVQVTPMNEARGFPALREHFEPGLPRASGTFAPWARTTSSSSTPSPTSSTPAASSPPRSRRASSRAPISRR